MNSRSYLFKWGFLVLAGIAVFSIDIPWALAQGCAMCQTAGSAQSAEGMQALNRAILVLLVPPVSIMSAIFVYAFWNRAPKDK